MAEHSSSPANCRTLKISVDIQAVLHGALDVFDNDRKYAKEFSLACKTFEDVTANRWLKNPETEEDERGALLTYFVGQERNRSSRRTFLFSMPAKHVLDDDEKQRQNYNVRFPFLPRRGEFVTIFYANSFDNARRIALQNDEGEDAAVMCRDLDIKEKLVLFAVEASSIGPCCGKINQHGIVQLIDRAPERVCILECNAPADSMGQVFLDADLAEECNIFIRNLHVGDRVLFSAVQNLHKVKFPLRPYKMSRMRVLADTAVGRQAADVTVECLNTDYIRGNANSGRFSPRVPKGIVLSFVISVDTLKCSNTVHVKGYRLLPPSAAYNTDDLSEAARSDNKTYSSAPESYADKWPLSFMDRSCLYATQPWLVDADTNRLNGGGNEHDDADGDHTKAQPVAYNSMYKWECEVGMKQTAKLKLKFVAARTGPFRANFALLTHNCEVLVPIRIDVYEGGHAPRLLIDTGCFRGQTVCRSLNFDDKFNLYALRHMLHHAKLIGWFDRRGVQMLEPSQFTTLDCQFGTQLLLQALGHQLQFRVRKAGAEGSTLFEAADRPELFQGPNCSSSTSGDSNDDRDLGDSLSISGSTGGSEADSEASSSSHDRKERKPFILSPAPTTSVLFPGKQSITTHNYTKHYKLQLQSEAVWRSWQYMEASLRNPRMRLSSSGRILYIDMSSNRSFLSHVQRIDDKCFVFLYMVDHRVPGEQLPVAYATGGAGYNKQQQPLYNAEDLPKRFFYVEQESRRRRQAYAMVAIAVNRVKNNELLCALPEGLELPFVDYFTETPTIRPYHDANEEQNDDGMAAAAFVRRQVADSPLNFTLFVSFKTLMVNLRRAYDALEIIQFSSLKPALAKILFPEQVQDEQQREQQRHAAVTRRTSTSSVESDATDSSSDVAATGAGAAAVNVNFGFRARHGPSEEPGAALKTTVPKCTQPHVYECPLADCAFQRLAKPDADLHTEIHTPPPVLPRPNGKQQKSTSSDDSGGEYSSRGSSCSRSSCSTSGVVVKQRLDVTQQSVLDNVVAGCNRPSPYVLIGPPGTGKTRTVASAILQVVQSDKTARVLVVASSNVAADLLYTLLTTGKQDVFIPETCEDTNDDDDDEAIVFSDEDIPLVPNNCPATSSNSSSASSSGYSSRSSQHTPVKKTDSVKSNLSSASKTRSASKMTGHTAPHHETAEIVSRDKILKPGNDIIRLFSDEHGRSTLIASDVRNDGICLKYSELKAENEDDHLLTATSTHAHSALVEKALRARVCVCTPSLAAHLHRRILDTQYFTIINGKRVMQMRYRSDPYTHLFVDEAGKCAEAELIVPMLALNLMPLIPPPPPPSPVPSPKTTTRGRRSSTRPPRRSSANAVSTFIPSVIVCTGHLKSLAEKSAPLVMLAGDPHQLGPTNVGMRGSSTSGKDEIEEGSNIYFSTRIAGSTTSPAADVLMRPPETLWTWNSVNMSLLTRLFQQYGYVQRKLAANQQPPPYTPPVLMTVLRNNYRNPKIIAEFLSQYFYHGHVVSKVPPVPLYMPSMLLIRHEKLTESRDEGPSVYNVEEARIVADLTMQFIQPAENNYQFWQKFSVLRTSVAILTPYRNQANAIRIQLFRALEEQVGHWLTTHLTKSSTGAGPLVPDWLYQQLLERTANKKLQQQQQKLEFNTHSYSDIRNVEFKDIADCFLPVVATIDEYQGREADNIILSLVRSRFTVPSMNDMLFKHFQSVIECGGNINAQSTVEEKLKVLNAYTTAEERDELCSRYLRRALGFVADDTRINEAITRACQRLFIVSNKKLLELCPTWYELLKQAVEVDADQLDKILM